MVRTRKLVGAVGIVGVLAGGACLGGLGLSGSAPAESDRGPVAANGSVRSASPSPVTAVPPSAEAPAGADLAASGDVAAVPSTPSVGATHSAGGRTVGPSFPAGTVAATAPASAEPHRRSPVGPRPRPTAGGGFAGGPGRPTMQAAPITRLLTASMVPDADDREAYLGFLGRQSMLAETVPLDTHRRLRVEVVDARGRPVAGAAVRVVGASRTVTGRTHPDGVWDFFPGLGTLADATSARIEVTAGSAQASKNVTIRTTGDSDAVKVELAHYTATPPRALELMFAIDATGSMEDELRYVNDEVGGIAERLGEALPNVRVRVGATFYRDRMDDQPIERIAMTSDVGAFTRRMQSIFASGGGDYPEDMNSGLEAVLEQRTWPEDAARVVVLIADAPPQRYRDRSFDFVDAARIASRDGVRILPVSASGSDREVEYLFRALCTVTSTPFVQLTNDSGIGGAHLAADAPAQRTEMFSDLLTRLLVADLRGEGMHVSGWQSGGRS